MPARVARTSNVFWLVAYIATMAGLVGGLFWVRQTTAVRLDSDAGQAAWEAWREKAREQSAGDGPVKRRVPKSAEPPTVVLLRDHFPMCLAAAVIFGSLLFFAVMFFVRGILRGDGGYVLKDDESVSAPRSS